MTRLSKSEREFAEWLLKLDRGVLEEGIALLAERMREAMDERRTTNATLH